MSNVRKSRGLTASTIAVVDELSNPGSTPDGLLDTPAVFTGTIESEFRTRQSSPDSRPTRESQRGDIGSTNVDTGTLQAAYVDSGDDSTMWIGAPKSGALVLRDYDLARTPVTDEQPSPSKAVPSLHLTHATPDPNLHNLTPTDVVIAGLDELHGALSVVSPSKPATSTMVGLLDETEVFPETLQTEGRDPVPLPISRMYGVDGGDNDGTRGINAFALLAILGDSGGDNKIWLDGPDGGAPITLDYSTAKMLRTDHEPSLSMASDQIDPTDATQDRNMRDLTGSDTARLT